MDRSISGSTFCAGEPAAALKIHIDRHQAQVDVYYSRTKLPWRRQSKDGHEHVTPSVFRFLFHRIYWLSVFPFHFKFQLAGRIEVR
jgi:hypothetical protein